MTFPWRAGPCQSAALVRAPAGAVGRVAERAGGAGLRAPGGVRTGGDLSYSPPGSECIFFAGYRSKP